MGCTDLYCICTGVNEEELAANRQLSQRLVQDLNRRPQLPGVASASQHAVVCSNGLQYLNRWGPQCTANSRRHVSCCSNSLLVYEVHGIRFLLH